ncbi:MAG: PDDEXK nuclease domain-containing protein [Verrucomicrobiales bacterium]|nr:PDDEXK nuclease domain-containing protein [Verrucomicrobiales bacterium]
MNSAMVAGYWKIGERIVVEEQKGEQRATYGKQILKNLAEALSTEFGKGLDERELRRIRQFYLTFPIRDTVRPELSWSHYRLLIRISDETARTYYMQEAAEQQWSYRTLERNHKTLYYQRLVSSQEQEPVQKEMEEKTAHRKDLNLDFIKDPYVMEFLQLTTSQSYTEKKLEQALLDNLQKFLLELGKGFSFVARQRLIRTETSDFYIDLVFYNYILKCFVLIELKTSAITHADIGQLDMYVRMFDDLQKTESDNPTIGILLCTETDQMMAKYSVLHENKQLFASKYIPFLPSEEELIAEIEREKRLVEEA